MLRDTLAWVAAKYAAAEIAATADERNLTLPGVLTLVKGISRLSLDHATADHEITLLLVAPGAGPLVDLDHLDLLAHATTEQFGCTDYEAVSVRLDRSPTPLPGLRTTIQIRSN